MSATGSVRLISATSGADDLLPDHEGRVHGFFRHSSSWRQRSSRVIGMVATHRRTRAYPCATIGRP